MFSPANDGAEAYGWLTVEKTGNSEVNIDSIVYSEPPNKD
jgi:hypothetical protein